MNPDTLRLTFPSFQDDIITRKDTGICQLPGSIFERLLLHAHARAELCHPWKSGFLIKKPHFKLKCEVKNGRTSSYVVLHGRCEKKYCKEMWGFILDIWKVGFSLSSFAMCLSLSLKKLGHTNITNFIRNARLTVFMVDHVR